MIGERVTVEELVFVLCHSAGRADREPLLLLHGFAGTPAGWAEVVEHLTGEFLVAAATLPGHGRRADDVPASFEEVLERLNAALVQLHAGPWRVGGYSMGARVALGLLVRNPERFGIASLVGVHPGLRSDEERRERLAWERGWAHLLRNEGIDAFLDKWEAQPLFATQAHLPAVQRAAIRAVRRSHHPEGLARALEVLGLAAMPNYWPVLRDIRVPVRLVVGERDSKFRLIAEAVAQELANARLHLVPAVGHNVPLEAPGAMASLLR